MDLGNGIPEFYWTFFAGAATFALKFLKDMSKSIQNLNTNLQVMIVRMDDHDKKIDNHEERLHLVETNRRK